jgi:hypothetical protein
MPLQADLVSIIFGMLQTRDEKIFEVHKNRHKNNDHYKEFKRNVFLPSSIYCDLKSDNITFDVVQYFPVSLPPLLFVDISSVRYIFIPVLIGENDLDKDDWELIYVDCLAKLIFVVDPKKRIFNPDKLVEIQLNVSKLLSKVFPNDYDMQIQWNSELCKINYFKALENDFDGGIYLILMVYFLIQDVPMYFSESDCLASRINLASWIKIREIPLHSFV